MLACPRAGGKYLKSLARQKIHPCQMEIREIGNTQGGKRTKDGEKWMRLIEGGKPHTPQNAAW